ncbi:MAG: PIN domain-containing protein [Anaerolineae bacterium]|nr:PIN domain-containing protein [Anaerolineae bacterium]
MTNAIADTTVVIHLYRRYEPALTWYRSLAQPLGITPVTWMEIMFGAGSKTKQTACKAILSQFDLIYLTSNDQRWAMQQMEKYRLSHGVAMGDCFIASVAYRLQIPLYTHNIKDMTPMIGSLAVKPYV